jgi:glutaredoxin-like protein
MNEWKQSQNAARVTFLPDGNGEFSDGMGLLVGKEDLGFGKRSWRYSMLVRDGVIEKMFVEPEEPGDPFHVSDADTMLKYLDPEGELPHDVAIFTRDGCPFCVRAKGLLRDAEIEFEELVLNRDYTDQTLRAVSSNTSYPQVFIDGKLIGGSDELAEWLQNKQPPQARTAA